MSSESTNPLVNPKALIRLLILQKAIIRIIWNPTRISLFSTTSKKGKQFSKIRLLVASNSNSNFYSFQISNLFKVFSSETSLKEGHAWFAKVPIKLLSDLLECDIFLEWKFKLISLQNNKKHGYLNSDRGVKNESD